MPQSNPGIYRRLLAYSLKRWPLMAIAVLGMVISALSEPAFAALMKPLLDGSFVERDPAAIRWVPIFLVLIFIARGGSGFITAYLMTIVGRGVVKSLRDEVFDKYLRMPTSFFDTTSSGELISKITYEAEQVAEATTNSITTLIRDSLTVLGLLGWMFYLNWQMTLGFLLIAPFVALIVIYVTRRFRRISRRIQQSMGQVTHVTQEMIEGIRVVKVFGGQDYERGRFDIVNERNRSLYIKMAMTKSASSPIVQFLVALSLAAMILFATQDKYHETITVGTFMSFMTAMMMLLTPIKRLTEVNATIQKAIAAGESIFTVLDKASETDNGQRIMQRAKGNIAFEQVSFQYPGNDTKVLDNISFNIEAGQTIALVGRSGSGKTTLVNLLPRFYEVSAGQVLLDGVPVNSLTLESLRSQFAYVGQHITLFNDTIRNNIAYGALQDISTEKVIAAAKAAHAWEFIQSLPKGLETQVGEKGLLLSGGQRQRLAIARALLKDAPVLILDEATASLDSESERYIQDAVEALSQNRTTVVIAHRLSTIENADCILVMEAGKIVESGTHQALLQQKGNYANLYSLQFGTG